MIREGLTPQEANQRFWSVDRQGLLIDDDPALRDFQRPYARTRDEVNAWTTTVPGRADQPRRGGRPGPPPPC